MIIMNNKNKSFTLIELLVVIVIIGILAGVVMISTSSSIDKANIAKGIAFSDSLKNSMLLNLVSEWKFDEPPIGTVVKDDWGNNNAVLNHGNESTTYPLYKSKNANECVSGGCYYFNGINKEYINTNNNLIIPREGVFFFWINGLATNQINQNIYPMGFYQFCLLGSSNTTDNKSGIILKRIGEPYTVYNWGGQGFFDGKWHNYIVSWDETTFYLYKDGIKIGSPKTHDGLPPLDDKRKFILGGSAWDAANYGHFTGKIDEVRLYDKLLSLNQVKELHIAGLNSLLFRGNISREEYNERISSLSVK
jgi:prepilin-type N-terminal cleavage/methylation domain-containing protein